MCNIKVETNYNTSSSAVKDLMQPFGSALFLFTQWQKSLDNCIPGISLIHRNIQDVP